MSVKKKSLLSQHQKQDFTYGNATYPIYILNQHNNSNYLPSSFVR